MFDNNFDPYEELLTCKHNCRELIKAYAHQQEVIEQLMFQVNKLNETTRLQNIKIARIEFHNLHNKQISP